jgi:acyl-CoA reductase-like NAD-dependent aldehyde dehydrogenase
MTTCRSARDEQVRPGRSDERVEQRPVISACQVETLRSYVNDHPAAVAVADGKPHRPKRTVHLTLAVLQIEEEHP